MAEYIEREDAINLLWLFADESCASVVPDFENLPAADVAEVRHARWNNWGYEPLWQECSACNYRIQYSYSKDCKFCPNCGARMDKEEEREVSE